MAVAVAVASAIAIAKATRFYLAMTVLKAINFGDIFASGKVFFCNGCGISAGYGFGNCVKAIAKSVTKRISFINCFCERNFFIAMVVTLEICFVNDDVNLKILLIN